MDSGYCGGPCGNDAHCKQLAAGCGASVDAIAGHANGGDGNGNVGRRSVDWGSQGCGRSEVESGQCRLCTEPLWCNDPGSSFGFAGRIDSPEAWIDEFFDRDGGRAYGTRQCKWKPSQKDLFIASMHAYIYATTNSFLHPSMPQCTLASFSI